MSSNGINVCDDAEMAECDDEKVVTMMDVLKEQEDFEEDANAVLGASDDKNCTYSKGYVKRQAIYACMTCCTDANNDPSKWAGVCLACSLACHENHELIELYTKRNFRCDCGNPKFNSHPCQFTPNKTDLNIDNIYNQNFSGVYCICHRPYPDPDSTTQGDMIQCIVCEDWLHSDHLDAVVPSNEQYSEMICKACMDKNEFLHDYSDLAVNKEHMDFDVLNMSSEDNATANCNENSNKEVAENENIANSISEDIINEQIDNNDTVFEVANKEDDTKKVENIATESEFSEECDLIKKEESSIETSKSDITPSELIRTNLTLNEKNICESENDNKSETELKSDIQPKETKVSSENTQKTIGNTGENQSSLIGKTLDSRTQEQVQEDELLADPMDTDVSQKDNVDLSNKVLLDENKSESEAMEVAEPVSENQIENTKDKNDSESRSELVNVPIDEQLENAAFAKELESTTTAKEMENVTSAEKSDGVATTEESKYIFSTEESESTANDAVSDDRTAIVEAENVKSFEQAEEVLNTEQLEDISNIQNAERKQTDNIASIEGSEQISIAAAEQSNIPADSKHSVDTCSSKELKNVSTDQSQNGSTTKQAENEVTSEHSDQHNKNDNNYKDVSENENNSASEESNSFEKNSCTDIIMDEYNADHTVNKDIANGSCEVNSSCDKNLPEADVLKRKLSTDGDVESVELKKPKLNDNKCVRPRDVKKVYHGATFWPSNFRHKLCTCSECISMYKDLSVLFLIDPDDTVTAYETLGKEKTDGKPASQYEKGMAALSSLGRVQQINALTEYTKLRDKLLDFLKTFKDKKVIVKEEDIKAFFAGMKPVREPDGVYFCR